MPRPAREFLGLVSEQSLYNLFVQALELEVLPAAQDYGVGVIAWSPLHGGLLGGVLRKERDGARRGAWRAGPTTLERPGEARSKPTRTCARASARRPPPWRWPGCCTNPE